MMKIKHITQQNKGAFVATENKNEAGRMTYSQAGDTRIIIDHTEVNPDFRGQGVGRKLLTEVVAYARENQLKILPLCAYAKSVFDKDESISDVLSRS